LGSLYRPKLKSGGAAGIWWAKYYVNGRPVRESTKCGRLEDARRFLKTREGAVATGAPIPPRIDRVIYDELAADLRTHLQTTGGWEAGRGAERRLAHLDKFFAGRRAVAITPDVLARYAAQRQKEPTHFVATRNPNGTALEQRTTANGTINLELALLRRMFRLAYKHGKVLRVPPFEILESSAPRAGFFEEDQYRAVLRHLPEDLRVAVAITQTYGWRVQSEVLPLGKRNLDLKAGTLRLEPGTTKNRDARVVYLTPELKSLLAAQLERVDALQRKLGRIIPHLFPHLTGTRRCGQPRREFYKRWRTACRKAGVPGRIPHDFRRTAVRNMERRSVPRSVAMKLTGHRSEHVYRRYAIVSDADLQEAARKLAGTFTGTFAASDEASPTQVPRNSRARWAPEAKPAELALS
jgi:integrase